MCFHVTARVKQPPNNAQGDLVENLEKRLRISAFDLAELPATFYLDQRQPHSLEWGLIPHWARNLEHARELQSGARNARAETLFEKPVFRDAARTGRCLIWLDGFYEWQHRGKKKVEYYIHMPGHETFPVGGLRSVWKDPQSGAVFETCTIVTTAANELMSQIHNSKQRMPLIIQPQHQADWLNHVLGPSDLRECIAPLPDGILIAEEVVAAPAHPISGDPLRLF